MSYSKITVLGRLGKDPKLGTTQNGKSFCNFSIAADSGSGDHKITTWFSVTVWGKSAEAAHKYLQKGFV
ncbi:MAG: single-stranded DNA-binding protein [Desulfurellales bacterium]|nr:MAG: single-stranded DNA-binding protein [Desulfurellales bacterium]